MPTPADPDSVRELEQHLGPGEAQSIALAREHQGWALLMDEHAGRGVARDLGLDVIGTVGLLLRAKRVEQIRALRPALNRLREDAGFWLSDGLYDRVLRIAGEAARR